jgi:exfoliative toxin A/B
MLKRIPLPLSGVMLGLAALGNLLQNYSPALRVFCGVLAVILGIIWVAKYVRHRQLFITDMKNPIMASVAGTFSMAVIILAGYLQPIMSGVGTGMWYIGITLHLALIIYFTEKFMLPPAMPKVFASYFIVYVGIAAAAINAPLFKQHMLGSFLCGFAMVSFAVLLGIVTYRYIVYKEVPQPAQSLFCIYAAPMSLCLAGYIQSVMPKSPGFILGMVGVATVIYIIVLLQLPKLVKLPFYPSAAAFTFPFVISAIALKQSFVCLGKLGMQLPALFYLAQFETALATVLVFWTLVRFISNILTPSVDSLATETSPQR